ncbi:MAG: hypothetical protein ACK459_09595 [Akkermansiaceae bacterium]|jgi:hypothetical protein
MKIALIENSSIGVNIHRLLTPYKHLAKDHEVIMTNGVVTTDYDVVVFNRLPNQCLTDIEKLKAKGVKIVVDLDDWIELPKYHWLHSKNKIKQIAPILDSLNLADVITTSTYTLQKELKKLGYNSEVLPNFIEHNVKNEPKEHAIGWVGGAGHVNNLFTMAKPMQADYKCKRILGGYTKGEIQSEWYAKIMSANSKFDLQVRKPTGSNYMELYKDITIGLLPSFNDTFTLCKSDLRALEYASMGIVGVTNGGCYEKTKAIKVTDKTFEKAVKRLINFGDYYSDMQEAQIEWLIERNDIKKITQKRLQIIDSLK